MESGKLQFDWDQSSETIAIISFGGSGGESSSLLRSLFDEASVSYPQLSQLRFVHIPLPVSKLENWSHWLAVQVAEQWRDLPLVECPVATSVEELGLRRAECRDLFLDALDKTATNISLTSQLAMRFQSLRERQVQQKLTPSSWQKWLDQEANGLAEWFTQPPLTLSGASQPPGEASGCLAQLQSNMLALRSKTLYQLQDCFVRLQGSGPRALLTYLSSLDETLDVIRTDYEAQRQDYLRRESSAWRAYYNLRSPLEERNWGWSNQVRLDWEAVLRALTTAYKFRLQVEIYTQAAQLVSELVQQTRLYAASIGQVDAVLASFQGWFTKHSSVEPIFIPFLQVSLPKRINPAQLRSELESWVGCALEHWNTLELLQSEALREQILTRIRPLCLEVYAECCRYVLNLENSDSQTRQAGKVSLHVRNAEIQDVLAVLSRASGEKMVADESISGTVSLTLHNFSVTEAMKALMAAGNLTYTKSGDAYIFSQLPQPDPQTAITELNEVN